jgi:hypothetical protein
MIDKIQHMLPIPEVDNAAIVVSTRHRRHYDRVNRIQGVVNLQAGSENLLYIIDYPKILLWLLDSVSVCFGLLTSQLSEIALQF